MAAGADRGETGPHAAGGHGRIGRARGHGELRGGGGVFASEGITFKKSLHASEQDRADVARHRARGKQHQGRLDAKRLVFIDETWAKTNMTRRHGRCARGARLLAKVPHGRWRTLTFLAALRCPCAATASMHPASSMGRSTGSAFALMSSSFWCRRSARARWSSWTISQSQRAGHPPIIRAAGAKLFFLPRYSPDRNPIEQVFSKLKTLLRKADPQTVEDTWKQIGAPRGQFTPEECANYLVNAGYAAT